MLCHNASKEFMEEMMDEFKSLSNAERKEYALQHYRNWQRSELSKIEYCRQNNLKTTTFNGWKRYLGIDTSKKITKIPSKTVKDLVLIEPCLELKFGKHLSIKINQNFNPDLLKRVLKTLGVLYDN